jgi:hypothetical protein
VSSNPAHDEVYSIQHYAIKFVWLASGRWFSSGTPISSTNQTDRNNIAEIMLKVELSTTPSPKHPSEMFSDDLLHLEISWLICILYKPITRHLQVHLGQSFLWSFVESSLHHPPCLQTRCVGPSYLYLGSLHFRSTVVLSVLLVVVI